MNIVFKISEGCGTSVKKFVINGIGADINDFGKLHISHYGMNCDYEFVTMCEDNFVKNKYGIDDEEMENVIAMLEQRLTGGCSLCE